MARLYRTVSNAVRPPDEEINEMEDEIAELDCMIAEVGMESLDRPNQLQSAEEQIERIQTWIEMASRHALDVDKIREDLQAQLDAIEELPSVDAKREAAVGSYKRSKQMSHLNQRKRFIERTSEDVLKNEAKTTIGTSSPENNRVSSRSHRWFT